jgi:CRP-like cAMP-binding protein
MSSEIPAEHLARSAIFGVLDADERVALARRGRSRAVPEETELFLEGDACREIQILLSGRVRLWRMTGDGHVLVLRVCEAGEVLGQMSAIDDGSHSISATTEEPCRLLQIPAGAFREQLQQKPSLALRLAAVLAQRVRSLSDELEAMKFASIGERVLGVLAKRAAGRREIRVTHQQLADQVGSTRENVSRVLGLLRDRGVLRLGRGRIEILDHEALERP